jgi:hypothetical protein
MGLLEMRDDVSSEQQLEQHLELEAEGWQRRFEADTTRARELVELYDDLGYEVTTRQIVPAEIDPECAGCAIVACQRYVALYTRRPTVQHD